MNEISKVDKFVVDILDSVTALLGMTFMIAFAILSITALVLFFIQGDFLNLVGFASAGLISWMFWSAQSAI